MMLSLLKSYINHVEWIAGSFYLTYTPNDIQKFANNESLCNFFLNKSGKTLKKFSKIHSQAIFSINK